MCRHGKRDGATLQLRTDPEPRPTLTMLVSGIAAFGLVVGALPDRSSTTAFPDLPGAMLAASIFAVLGLIWWALAGWSHHGDFAAAGPTGVWPSSRSRLFVPAAAIAGIEVRHWRLDGALYRRGIESVNLSLLLADGRRVILPALARRSDWRTGKGRSTLAIRTGGGGWVPIQPEVDGSETLNASNGEAFAMLLLERLRSTFGDDSAPDEVAAGRLRLGGLGDDRHRPATFFRTYRRSSAQPALEPEPPTTKTDPRTGSSLPSWNDFTVPATYTTRASEARRRVGRSGRSVTFGEAGVVLRRRRGTETIAYAEIDEFTIEATGGEGWSPTLRTADGDWLRLPGLDHSAWNDVLYTGENALLWRRSPGDEPGSLRWHGPDDDDLVIARLNAQLDFARSMVDTER